MVPEGLPLSPEHWEKLHVESAISEEVIRARGYETIPDGDEGHQRLQALGFSRAQYELPALLVPIHGVTEHLKSFVIRPDKPREGVGKYQFLKGERMLLDVPPGVLDRLGDPSEALFITEGAKKVDSLASADYVAVGLAGVWNWRGKNSYGGSVRLPDWDHVPLENKNTRIPRQVVVAFDADVLTKTPVQDARNRLTNALKQMGADVFWLELPAGPLGKIDDFLAARIRALGLEGARSELRELIVEAEVLPEIDARRGDLTEVARESWDRVLEAREGDPRIYSVGGIPSYLTYASNERAKTERVNTVAMQCILSEVARYYIIDGRSNSKKYIPPPALIANAALTMTDSRVPELLGVYGVPFFTKSGALVLERGYNKESRFFLEPVTTVTRMPDVVTWEHVEAAKALILDTMLRDFPFDSEASRANAVSVMIEQVLQPMIDGPSPLHIISAPTAGTGKGYLTKCLMRPMLARLPAMRPAPVNDDEWRKIITTGLLEGERGFVIDNLSEKIPLDSASLAGALTSGMYQDRILGESRSVDGKISWSWLALGNNPTVSFEIARRAVWTRLDADVERPWEREVSGAFLIEDLMTWLEENADEVLRAVLTLVMWWRQEGRRPSLKTLGSFERWSQLVGGVLESVGIEGFLDNQISENAEAVKEDEGWAEFLDRWWELYGSAEQTTGVLYGVAKPIIELYGKDEEGLKKSLGRQLGQRKDRVYGTKKIKKGHARKTWALTSVVGEDGTGRAPSNFESKML